MSFSKEFYWILISCFFLFIYCTLISSWEESSIFLQLPLVKLVSTVLWPLCFELLCSLSSSVRFFSPEMNVFFCGFINHAFLLCWFMSKSHWINQVITVLILFYGNSSLSETRLIAWTQMLHIQRSVTVFHFYSLILMHFTVIPHKL